MKNIKIIIALLVLLTISSCSRHIDSRDPIRSLPEAGPIPEGVTAIVNLSSVDLSWTVSDAGSVARFRVYLAEGVDGDFIFRDSTAATSITIVNLSANRTYRFKVAPVLLSGLEGIASEELTVVTTPLSISIQNSEGFVNNRTIQISISGPTSVTQVKFSENIAFTNAAYEAVGTSRSFTLSSGDGSKIVYARFKYSDGSETGDPVADTVILDTRAEIAAFSFSPSGTIFGPGDSVFFELTAGESGGRAAVTFGSINGLPLYDDGSNTDDIAGDAVHHGFFVVPNNFNLASVLVTGSFQDRAGNNALQVTSAEALTIYSPPVPVTVSVVAEASFKIRINWTAATSSNFSAYRIYKSTSSTVNESSELLDIITGQSSTTLVDTALDASTTYYYRVYTYDRSGLTSGSNTASTTTFANFPPTQPDFFLLNQTTATAEFSWTANGEVDFESYRIFRSTGAGVDNGDVLVAKINARGVTSYTYDPPTPGNFFFRIYVYDKHGVSTGSSNSINVAFSE